VLQRAPDCEAATRTSHAARGRLTLRAPAAPHRGTGAPWGQLKEAVTALEARSHARSSPMDFHDGVDDRLEAEDS
jgi:hypothetical protein